MTHATSQGTDSCDAAAPPDADPPDATIDAGSNDLIERVSESSGGIQANNDTTNGLLNFDGRFVAIDSAASNLIAGGTYAVFESRAANLVYGSRLAPNAAFQSLRSAHALGMGAYLRNCRAIFVSRDRRPRPSTSFTGSVSTDHRLRTRRVRR